MRKPNEKHPEPSLTFPPPSFLANVTILLVEPAAPGNIGSSARAIKTMGLSNLVVLNGVNFRDELEAIKLGHGAGDILEQAKIASTWEEATADLHWLIGTTHRKRRMQFSQPLAIRQAAEKAVGISKNHRVGIVFGREESGLSDVELRRCNDISSIPSGIAYPSLNLSQAVMLYSYEIFMASLQSVPSMRYELATIAEVESVLDHLGTSLAQIGFRPHQGDPDSFVRSLRRVISRTTLEKRDCNVLHRVCQQIDYYVRKHEGKC